MIENLGSGIKLTSDWDFEVDPTGDLATVSGTEELAKDASMLTAIQLEDALGEPISMLQTNSLKSVEVSVERLLRQDPRVSDVASVTARPSDAEDTITVDVQVVTDADQDYNLVFEVGG